MAKGAKIKGKPGVKAKAVAKPRYTMRISRMTVDKLGVKLYDRASAALAELVANSYDADAKEVVIEAPMGELLATLSAGQTTDKGFEIVVRDNGIGMTPEEVNEFYLRVGRERRTDPKRGDTSKELHRKVMGRKGVGKLAPFGICSEIEVLTSGGPKTAKGYQTAHLVLQKEKILNDTDTAYHPDVGEHDGTFRPQRGTELRLRQFSHRHVPDIGELSRQLSQRFGISQADWSIKLVDNRKAASEPDSHRIVGGFDLERLDGTTITFAASSGKSKVSAPPEIDVSGLEAGFTANDKFYPVTGWVSYSKIPYKDDLMVGVRIYCRGKIAAQTAVFNRKAGFTGEHDVRSYLVGELHADWLDEEEDLIQTDRRDILWSHELGQEFEKWGQKVVLLLGRTTREPLRKQTWELFKDKAKFDQSVDKAFPSDSQKELREKARELGRMLCKNIRHDELNDKEYLSSMVQLTLDLSPHIALNEQLRDAAESSDNPLSALVGILRTARIAELSSFGRIAEDRVKVIERLEELKDDSDSLEGALQQLITEAPWLIDPQWSPMSANQRFATLKSEFEKAYKKQTGNEIKLNEFSDPKKRADFVLAGHEGRIEIIEIKKPNHALDNTDYERIDVYNQVMEEFLNDPGNSEFKKMYQDFHITVVCDSTNLTGTSKTAFQGLKGSQRLSQMNWSSFLLRTKKMHESFLEAAERHKRLVTKN